MAFSPPDFLQDQDALSILQRMMSHLPPDLEQMEAGFTWDLLMPVALEQAETLQYKFIQVLQIMFRCV